MKDLKQEESLAREIFWTTLQKNLDTKAEIEEWSGQSISGVRTVLHTFETVREAYGYEALIDIPEQLFRDLLLALRQMHPHFTMRDFGRAARYSGGHLQSMISTQPSNRARCRVRPRRYERLLAIFTNPADFVAPSGPYGKWST